MNRKFGWILAASLCPGPAFALGLGKLVLDSGLNEPLEARIELLSPTREELDSLAVALADSEAFERAGVEREFILSGLKFELQEGEVGPDFIRVYSRDAIREPFLNFLVEINWSKGRLVREYTVLLDPPLYDPGMRAPAATVAAPRRAPEPELSDSGGMIPETEMDSGAEAPAAAVSYTGGDYGPTQQNDTLWSIASRMRPNESVSVQQMMLALYRTNPEAFINNNINGLRRGHVLRVPPESELAALSREQAFAEAQAQNSAWDPSQIAQAATPAPQVAAAAPQPASPAAAPAPTAAPAPQPAKEAELRLVAPGTAGTGASGEAGATDKNLVLANEQLSALTQENIDLKDRVKQAETIIEDLKLLIALKDEELAALQKNLAARAAQPETPAAAAPAPVAKETEPEAASAKPEPAPEEAAAPPKEPVTPEPEAQAPEPAPAKETPAATPAPEKSDKPPAAKPPQTASGVIMQQALTWLKGNLMIIGGALGAIVVVIAGLMFVSRRKQASAVASEDEAAAAVQFPDFAGSEDETILPGATAGDEAEPEVEKRGAAARPEAKPAPAPKPQAVAPAPAPAPEAPQEDPLAEVNVFLAYEHFDQAEQFVREAINREPDNLDFHSKLLEVFYAANDRRKYEQAARVLHDKVGGSGPHWDMALVMWNEISPNRALFSEPAADEDQAPAPAAGVGMLDLTSKEKSAPADDGSLDFDLGEMTSEPSAQAAAAPREDAGDVLDVTASVGLGTDEEMLSAAAGDSEDVLDLTGGQGEEEEGLPEPVSAPTGDDLLDVTAHSNLEDAGLDADPLDVTVAAPSSVADEIQSAAQPAAATGGSMDFDLSLEPAAPAGESNLIEFESGPGPSESGEKEGELELDLGAGAGSTEDADAGMDLDIGAGKDDDLGLSLEMPGADEAGAGELSLDGPGIEAGELDLSFEDANSDGAGELSLDMGEEGGDQTVFVPRTDGTQAQSAEDEIATKLDLAKAYVELGDKSSARGILDEIASAGNEEQRRQAEELRQQAI